MITYKEPLFLIETKNSSYIFAKGDFLENLYWGKKIEGEDMAQYLKGKFHSSFEANLNLERQEYSFWSGFSFEESCLKVNYPEIRKLDMKYISYDIKKIDTEQERLTIRFKNSYTDLYVDLIYDVFAEYDIIKRYVNLRNEGEEVVIENLKSACAQIPSLEQYRIQYLSGKWAGENQINEQYLTTGAFTIQSRCGNTGPHYNPCFAMDDGTATEAEGDVWFGLLGYSGNWQLIFEKTIFNYVKVTGGISDFDFQYTLHGGESIQTPAMILGHSAQGFGGMSRRLHRFEEKHIFPKKSTGRVLYNSWEATCFDVRVGDQKALAERAAKIGVELFVIDDGWFGQRNSDHAGLGDWYVNQEKFPNGLSELIDHVRSLGMDFGIWVEPEAVNPDSDLYRKHPDWIYRFKDQEPLQARNQYTLNISKPEVKQFILDFMTKLLSENPEISFIKWDMNKTLNDVSQGNTAYDKELWYRHVKTLYEIWAELRERFPKVEFEACAGGGSRVDLGILQYADQCWPSDNTDAYERLFIQEGFSYFYAPRIMTAWVTDASTNTNRKYERPYSYRFHSSMMGNLGIGANINRLSGEALEEFAKHIALYKEIRETIQHGRQYRLSSVRKSPLHAVEYISEDEKDVVAFAFRQGYQFSAYQPNLKFAGLQPEAQYAIEGTEQVLHGSTLMNVGIETALWGDFDSQMIRLKRI